MPIYSEEMERAKNEWCHDASKTIQRQAKEIAALKEKIKMLEDIGKSDGEYITDGLGNCWETNCPICNCKMEVVRPGRAQCSNCG